MRLLLVAEAAEPRMVCRVPVETLERAQSPSEGRRKEAKGSGLNVARGAGRYPGQACRSVPRACWRRLNSATVCSTAAPPPPGAGQPKPFTRRALRRAQLLCENFARLNPLGSNRG